MDSKVLCRFIGLRLLTCFEVALSKSEQTFVVLNQRFRAGFFPEQNVHGVAKAKNTGMVPIILNINRISSSPKTALIIKVTDEALLSRGMIITDSLQLIVCFTLVLNYAMSINLALRFHMHGHIAYYLVKNNLGCHKVTFTALIIRKSH